MSIARNDTISLMQAMERIKPPASFLTDTFFPNVPPVALTTKIEVEYRKGGRRLAPYIIRGSRGVNMSRDKSNIQTYTPPMLGARRTLGPEDIEQRGFGESVYSTMTPEQRAARMQAEDLRDLQAAIVSRKNKMAADILSTGRTEIKGYADDGKLQIVDEVDFSDWDQEYNVATKWSDPGADIYHDIKAASEAIQENAGEIPTVMIVGKNIEDYLLDNDAIMKWLAVPSTTNLSMMNFAPKFTSPQIRRIGLIQALNLEVYSYAETYLDDDGEVKPFLAPDDVIIAIPGRGRQLHGAVTLLNKNEEFESFAGEYVPQYYGNRDSNQMSLTLYSRVILAPAFADEWATIHSCTKE